jgi:orotate phosphoribosyltransferase
MLKNSLFEKKSFIMHSGEKSDFKIECDTLTSEDIETLAYLISRRFEFNGVYGIPTGGVKIANALKKYTNKKAIDYLIVDDVITTGNSMEEAADKFKYREPIIGVVLFARNRYPISRWIYPMFSMSKWWS